MTATLKKSLAVYLAVTTLAIGVAATANPAAAKPMPPHLHHHFHGYGPWLGLGLVGAVAASQLAYDPCVETRPIYDRWGNYLGRETVNACD